MNTTCFVEILTYLPYIKCRTILRLLSKSSINLLSLFENVLRSNINKLTVPNICNIKIRNVPLNLALKCIYIDLLRKSIGEKIDFKNRLQNTNTSTTFLEEKDYHTVVFENFLKDFNRIDENNPISLIPVFGALVVEY